MRAVLDALGEALFSDERVTSYDYVVQIAKRCFLAGYLWRCGHDVQSDVVYTSDTGIHAYVDRIARTYEGSEGTPARILIEDDFLIHGSSLGRMVEGFVGSVVSKMLEDGFDDEKRAREVVLSHTDICVYVANQSPLLLKNDVLRRVHPTKVADMNRLRESSVAFVDELGHAVDHNTPEVLCARTSCAESAVAAFPVRLARDWGHVRNNLREYPEFCPQEVYRLQLRRRDIVFAVRKTVRSGHCTFIPELHYGALSRTRLHLIANELLKCTMRRLDWGDECGGYQRMVASALEVDDLAYGTALVNMLLCQMGLSVFLGYFRALDHVFNTRQVADYYGNCASEQVLATFACVRYEKEDLEDVLRHVPGLNFRIAAEEDYASSSSVESEAFLGCAAAGYRQALESELMLGGLQQKRAHFWRDYGDWQNRWNEKRDLRKLTPTSEWSTFVLRCTSENNSRLPVSSARMLDNVLAAIGAISDRDLLGSTYVTSSEQKRGQVVRQSICTTEMSLSILPSLLHPRLWKWFKELVYHCRARGISIANSMRRRGYDEEELEVPEKLLADAAGVLDGRQYLDAAILGWDARD